MNDIKEQHVCISKSNIKLGMIPSVSLPPLYLLSLRVRQMLVSSVERNVMQEKCVNSDRQ